MNLDIIFKKDDNKEWELAGIFSDEENEKFHQGAFRDVFFRYKIIDQILEILKQEDSGKSKTAFATVPCPIIDTSHMMIAYYPLTIDEMHDEMIKDRQD